MRWEAVRGEAAADELGEGDAGGLEGGMKVVVEVDRRPRPMYHTPGVLPHPAGQMYHNGRRVPQSRAGRGAPGPAQGRRAMAGVSVPDAGRLARVEIVVTSVGADGTVRQAMVDTVGRVDADWWEQLAAFAHLEVPPPYRPEPGQPVYEVRVGEHVAQVSEGDLAGPLRELVTAVLAQGGVGG